jgi:hypothetical protein
MEEHMIHPIFRRIFTMTALMGSMSIALLASAQSAVSDADRSTARSLAENGAADFKSGDYMSAVRKFERAYAIAKVPKLALWYARALVKVGRLVEASERYAEATRLDANGPKAAEQRAAQADAESERQQLLPLIPTLSIAVEGAAGASIEVTIDGAPVPSALLSEARPVNPGKHQVKGKRGQQVESQEVSLAEADQKTVTFHFAAASKAPGVGPVTAATVSGMSPIANPTAGTGNGNVPVPDQPKTSSVQKTSGWMVLSVGGAGLAFGAVTGILVLSKKSSLDRSGQCLDNSCPTTQHAQVSSYNSLRTLSTIGLVVGAVGTTAGVTLLLTAPKRKEATVSAWVGPASAGLEGSF